MMKTAVKKLFGGLNLTWPKLILFAVIAGVYTGLINQVPFLYDTSFRDIAITFDRWILFGILIIMNSKSNLDSGLKCFVFFLISQPLVYLSEVPFLGWQVMVLQELDPLDDPHLPDGLHRLLHEEGQMVGTGDPLADAGVGSLPLRKVSFRYAVFVPASPLQRDLLRGDDAAVCGLYLS